MRKRDAKSTSARRRTKQTAKTQVNIEHELFAANQRLQSILSSNEVATWSWDIVNNRVIADENLTRMFDLNPKDAIGSPIENYLEAIHPDDRSRVSAAITSAMQGPDGRYDTEYRIIHKDGSVCWVTARGKVQHDSNGTPRFFPGVVIDITQRKASQQEAEDLHFRLERQSRLLDITLSSISDFAYIFDRKGCFVFVNQALLDLWGLTLDQAVGKNFFDLKYPDDLATRLQEQIQRVFKTRKGLTDETSYTSPTGTSGYYEYIFRPVFDRNGNVEVVAGSTREITQRKRSEEDLRQSQERLRVLADTLEQQVRDRTNELEERNQEVLTKSEQLRALSIRLMEMKDHESRILARELHDSVGQMLAALTINQSKIVREKERLSQRCQVALSENVEMTEQILKEIRTISHLLHPPLLDEVGLESALRCYLDGINERSKMSVDLEVAGEFGRLSLDVETAVFRVIQECLTNAHRHAKSDRATVILRRTPGEVQIVVSDEGIGIPESKIAQIKSGMASGIGMRGMIERIAQLGGTLDIKSGEKGTQIEVRLPIP